MNANAMSPEQKAMACDASLQRLAKWRSVYAGWMWGTQTREHGPSQATRDLFEKAILLRAEVSALTALLIESGVITQEQFLARLYDEAEALQGMLERAFPGYRATAYGMSMDTHIAADTMRVKGFPK